MDTFFGFYISLTQDNHDFTLIRERDCPKIELNCLLTRWP
jgi:hypothetical protein